MTDNKTDEKLNKTLYNVYLDGIQLDRKMYTVDSEGQVVFTTPPLVGVVVEMGKVEDDGSETYLKAWTIHPEAPEKVDVSKDTHDSVKEQIGIEELPEVNIKRSGSDTVKTDIRQQEGRALRGMSEKPPAIITTGGGGGGGSGNLVDQAKVESEAEEKAEINVEDLKQVER